MKSLEEKLNELGVNALELGSSPAYLESYTGIDYAIIFEAIEHVSINRWVDGFGEVYHYLHDELNKGIIDLFLEEAEEFLGADSEAFEELDLYISLYVEGMLQEAEDLVK